MITEQKPTRRRAGSMLSDYIVVGPKLDRCFRGTDPKVVLMVTGVYFSAMLLVVLFLKAMHHALGMPSLPYLWESLMSLCA